MNSNGGSAGPLWGTVFSGFADAAPEDTKEVSLEELHAMLAQAKEDFEDISKAKIGDKTMVDALSPAVDALAANADKGLLEMLKAAEEGAKQGVENTKKYVAKFGRAKSLLERAIGHQDAGATSVNLIFQGMREFVEGKLA